MKDFFAQELGNLKVKGSIKWEETIFAIKDSVAIWSQDKNKLEIFFFPFELTPQAVEQSKKTQSKFPLNLISLK